MVSEKEFLFGIGAMKAGTTWLAQYMSDHPDFCISPLKEVHYFDAKYRPDLCRAFDKLAIRRLKWIVNNKIHHGGERNHIIYAKALLRRIEMMFDESAYFSHFNDVYKGEKVVVDVTPTYALLKSDGFQRIREMCPNSRFLFVLRNPVERYWSHLRFSTKSRSGLSPVDEAEELLADPQYWERSDYVKTLERLRMVVSEEDIHVCFYEDIFDYSGRGREEIRRIERFCDVRNIDPDFGKVVGKSREIKLPDDLRSRLVRRLSSIYTGIDNLMDSPLPESWRRDMSNFLRPS